MRLIATKFISELFLLGIILPANAQVVPMPINAIATKITTIDPKHYDDNYPAWALGKVGDFNGDGIDDIILSAQRPLAEVSYPQWVGLFYGRKDWDQQVSL